MTSNTIRLIREEQDVSAVATTDSFVNTRFRTKIAVASPDSLSGFYEAHTEKIVIPRSPIRRLQAAHPAIEGTAREFESRLVDFFPQLADVEPEEIEKALRRM